MAFPLGNFLPYIDPDLSYKPAENLLITDEEIKYLFENFNSINDKIPVICLKTIEYNNGCQYYGEFNQTNNQKHGRGILKWPNGRTFYGQFQQNKANGKGHLIFKENEEYIGDFFRK